MSNCNFTIPFTGDPSSILSKARAAVEAQNGVFNGDANSGTFEVTILSNTVTGEYTILGQVMNLKIFNKPFFVPCSTIEGFLRSKMS